MRFPILKSVGLTAVLLVGISACREAVEATPPVGSCDLLSAEEMTQVEAEVMKIIHASESRAAWGAWWQTHGTNPFTEDITQSATYIVNGSSWAVTDVTDGYPLTARFQWPDGSVVVFETDGEFSEVSTLTFPDKTVAVIEVNSSGYNLSNAGTRFEIADWRYDVDETNDNDYTTFISSKAPYGTRSTTQAGFGEAAHAVSDDITFDLPKLSLTVTFETDTKTARAEVVWNGETRRFAGRAAACEAFVARLGYLYPNVYTLFDAGTLLYYPVAVR